MFFLASPSEVRSIKSPVVEHMEAASRGKHPLLGQQSSTHSMSFSDKEEREPHLPNGRSISLMDLQDSYLLQSAQAGLPVHEAPPRLGRVGSQASIGAPPLPPHHLVLHHQPHHSYQPAAVGASPQPGAPQVKAQVARDNLPQSAPQVRRPIHPSLSQQRSLQPLSFQNPVYHLSNLHAAALAAAGAAPHQHHPHSCRSSTRSTRSAQSLQADSSSENLSTASSRSASPSPVPATHPHHHHHRGGSMDVPGGARRVPSTCSLEDELRRCGSGSVHLADGECAPVGAARWHPPLADSLPGAQAVAVPRQGGSSAGTAHIVKVEQQCRTAAVAAQVAAQAAQAAPQAGTGGNGGARTPRSLPHSASLRSSSSTNTEPAAQSGGGSRSRQQSTCSRESPVPPVRGASRQQVQTHSAPQSKCICRIKLLPVHTS